MESSATFRPRRVGIRAWPIAARPLLICAKLHGSEDAKSGSVLRLRFDQLRDVESPVRILQVEGASLKGARFLIFSIIFAGGRISRSLAQCGCALSTAGATGAQSGRPARSGQALCPHFLPDGSLADEASVALGRIRRDIDKQQKSIQESLERFMRAHRNDGTLQEDFVTIREDRFVVPIVAGHKGRVDGVIHGSSGTGRTLFLEPLETIGLNNQFVRLREDELREIERILAEITNALREHAGGHQRYSRSAGRIRFDFRQGGFRARL